MREMMDDAIFFLSFFFRCQIHNVNMFVLFINELEIEIFFSYKYKYITTKQKKY